MTVRLARALWHYGMQTDWGWLVLCVLHGGGYIAWNRAHGGGWRTFWDTWAGRKG